MESIRENLYLNLKSLRVTGIFSNLNLSLLKEQCMKNCKRTKGIGNTALFLWLFDIFIGICWDMTQ